MTATTKPPSIRPLATDSFDHASNPAIEGLWVLLVQNEGELTHKTPWPRARDGARRQRSTYLLVFKDVVKARRFVANQDLDGAEPRMVVRGNRDDIIRIARSAGVVGTLLDYDPATQQYRASDPPAGVAQSGPHALDCERVASALRVTQ